MIPSARSGACLSRDDRRSERASDAGRLPCFFGAAEAFDELRLRLFEAVLLTRAEEVLALLLRSACVGGLALVLEALNDAVGEYLGLALPERVGSSSTSPVWR